jgi:hypothetical protein
MRQFVGQLGLLSADTEAGGPTATVSGNVWREEFLFTDPASDGNALVRRYQWRFRVDLTKEYGEQLRIIGPPLSRSLALQITLLDCGVQSGPGGDPPSRLRVMSESWDMHWWGIRVGFVEEGFRSESGELMQMMIAKPETWRDRPPLL